MKSDTNTITLPTRELLDRLLEIGRRDETFGADDTTIMFETLFELSERIGDDNHEDPLYALRIEIDGRWWEAEHAWSGEAGVGSWFDMMRYPHPRLDDLNVKGGSVTLYEVEPYDETIVVRRWRRVTRSGDGRPPPDMEGFCAGT